MSGKSKSKKFRTSSVRGKRLGLKTNKKHRVSLKKNGSRHKTKASSKKSRLKAKHRH